MSDKKSAVWENLQDVALNEIRLIMKATSDKNQTRLEACLFVINRAPDEITKYKRKEQNAAQENA